MASFSRLRAGQVVFEDSVPLTVLKDPAAQIRSPVIATGTLGVYIADLSLTHGVLACACGLAGRAGEPDGGGAEDEQGLEPAC